MTKCNRRAFLTRASAGGAAIAAAHLFRSESVALPAQAARFPLILRVPAWAEGATLRVSGQPEVRLKPGAFHRIEREWAGTVPMDVRFPMKAKISFRYNNAIAIERGPLVYSLSPQEAWTRVNADKPFRELPHGDFEVRPATPWNYGLLVDDKNPDASLRFEEQALGEKPFSPDGAGMAAKVRGRLLKNWRLAHGWAGEFAPGLQESAEPLQDLTLIPYGCTNIRITEFPRLKS